MTPSSTAILPVPMRTEDLDELMRIEEQIYPFPWSRANFVSSLDAGYDAWRFLAPDGDMVGYAVLMWVLDEVHLLNLSIAAEHQGHGLGGRCLRWLMGDIVRRGATSLLLEVRPSNLPALHLYERTGLQRIGIRRDYYPQHDGRREDAIVMHVRLPGSDGSGPRPGVSSPANPHDV